MRKIDSSTVFLPIFLRLLRAKDIMTEKPLRHNIFLDSRAYSLYNTLV